MLNESFHSKGGRIRAEKLSSEVRVAIAKPPAPSVIVEMIVEALS